MELQNKISEIILNTNIIPVNKNLLLCYLSLPKNIRDIAIFLSLNISNSIGYNEKNLDLETILGTINPNKYKANKNLLETDKTNLLKNIKDLNENNIIYTLSFKRFSIRIFFIEENILSWKYYNLEGEVSIGTIRRIVNNHEKIINCAINLSKNKLNRYLAYKYFSRFLDDLLQRSKIGISCCAEDNYEKNIEEVKNKINDIKEKEMEFDLESLVDSVPVAVKDKLDGIEEVCEMKKRKKTRTEDDIIPKEAKIYKKHISRKKREEKIVEAVKEFEEHKWRYEKDIDPFENNKSFYQYYRNKVKFHSIQSFSGEAPCFSRTFGAEAIVSGQIIDKLIKINKNNNKLFLDKWIEWFCHKYLNSYNIKNQQSTNLLSFKHTLEDFIRAYIEG